MRIKVCKLSREGDSTLAIVEGPEKIQVSLEELFSYPAHFVAVDGQVVFSVEDAMQRIGQTEESEVLIGKQVAGG